MSNPNLAINFNVFDQDPARQELQKAQTYINTLNSEIIALQAENDDLTARMVAVEKYIADHP